MSDFSTLILAETDIVDYYSFSEERGTGTFGPNFFPTIGVDEMFRYGDDSVDTFHVTTPSDFGYEYVNTGLDSGYFGGGEIDYNDNSFAITSPAPWSIEFFFKITDNTNVTSVFGLQDFMAGNGFGINHDPAQGFLLYTSSTTTPDAIYANPDGPSFAGEYHHVVIVVDDPSIKLYVDKVLAINLTQSLTLDGSSGSGLTFGFSYYLGFGFTSMSGITDELVVYNKALSLSTITSHYNALFDVGSIIVIDHNNIPLSFWRAGNAMLDFIGDGQFERWRGGISPVLGLSEKANKIQVYTDGYVFDTAPIKEVTSDAIIADIHFTEITSDGYVFVDTVVYADAIVKGTNNRLYPRDSTSRTEQIVNRNYPLEP